MERELCGKPLRDYKGTTGRTCHKGVGHSASCLSAQGMERDRERKRESYLNPEFRERKRARRRVRYRDPEVRKRDRESARERARERRLDPEGRESERKATRKWKANPANRPKIFATQARAALRRIEKRIEAA